MLLQQGLIWYWGDEQQAAIDVMQHQGCTAHLHISKLLEKQVLTSWNSTQNTAALLQLQKALLHC